MRAIRFLMLSILVTVSFSFAFFARAGIRGPGKYCGVVIFDRWDTCFLLSGPYITYVAEAVKGELRPYRGQATQVDARDVLQPMNPGDALIRQYKIIGPAPKTRPWINLDGLELVAASDFNKQATPRFLIQIRNGGSGSVRIDSSEIAPVLVARESDCGFGPFDPSDGASVAIITRVDLEHSPSGTRECSLAGVSYSASYSIDYQQLTSFELAPGQLMSIKITFELPAGQYQFLFAYGGGVHEEKSLASNAISFDIGDGGAATLVE